VLGIVTIEDILESIIHDEIFDEADYDRQNNPNIHKLEMSIDRSIIQEDVEYLKGELEEKYKEKLKSSLITMLEKKAGNTSGPMGTTLQVPNLLSPGHNPPTISVKKPSSVVRNARRGSLPRNVEMREFLLKEKQQRSNRFEKHSSVIRENTQEYDEAESPFKKDEKKFDGLEHSFTDDFQLKPRKSLCEESDDEEKKAN
jgi:hypothetical protein